MSPLLSYFQRASFSPLLGEEHIIHKAGKKGRVQTICFFFSRLTKMARNFRNSITRACSPPPFYLRSDQKSFSKAKKPEISHNCVPLASSSPPLNLRSGQGPFLIINQTKFFPQLYRPCSRPTIFVSMFRPRTLFEFQIAGNFSQLPLTHFQPIAFVPA